jgi:hypothetical protein
MKKHKLSKLQTEYRGFFLSVLREYDVRSPADLVYEKKREFFLRIREGWKLKKASLTGESTSEVVIPRDTRYADVKSGRSPQILTPKHHTLPKQVASVQVEGAELGESHVVLSVPNPEQVDGLTINYHPNQFFDQPDIYNYPVVKMPQEGSLLKLPRLGRSDSRGFKELSFFESLRKAFGSDSVRSDLHLTIPHFNSPYEPDIVLVDKAANLYVDIEIDEPYDGYYRCPSHEFGKDDLRDQFFTESGWVVIRFTERQIHLFEDKCIQFIRDVLNSILHYQFEESADCPSEPQWDYQQAVRWEKSHYRENYLGIDRFGKQIRTSRIRVDVNESEGIEKSLNRSQHRIVQSKQDNIAFEEETHTYYHPKDLSGNAKYLSVTTLIDRFFPFDLDRFISRKAREEGRREEEVLEEFVRNRDEAAQKGTYLHEQIERFLKAEPHDSSSKEFRLFKKFYQDVVAKDGLSFVEAEKKVLLEEFNIAGTIDAIFKKPNLDEYVVLDWKRSRKLVIDGNPKKYGFGFALSELSHLDNSSYYKYALQQNLYKHILQQEYGMRVSSLNLIVLHELFDDYFRIKIADMSKEVSILLESLNHKI